MTDTTTTARKYFISRLTRQIHSVQAPTSYSGFGGIVLYDSQEEAQAVLDAALQPLCGPDPGDVLGDADGSEMDDCQICGKALSEGSVCHWDSPYGSICVAFTCSRECADLLEQKRSADGVLRLEQTVEIAEDEPQMHVGSSEYDGDYVEAWQYDGPTEGVTRRFPARLGVEYKHDALCYDLMLETYDGSIVVSVEVGSFLAMCRRMTGDPDMADDPADRPETGAETYTGEPFQTDSDAFGDWDVLYADLDAQGADGPIVLEARFGVGYDSRRHTYQAIAEDAEGHAIVVWFDDDDWIALCGRILGY